MYGLLDRKTFDVIEAPETVGAGKGTPFDCRNVVHPLLFCPPVPKGIRYLLVRRTPEGAREMLHAGRASSPHPTLNLATIRRTAATLGANEVHVLPPDLCVAVAH